MWGRFNPINLPDDERRDIENYVGALALRRWQVYAVTLILMSLSVAISLALITWLRVPSAWVTVAAIVLPLAGGSVGPWIVFLLNRREFRNELIRRGRCAGCGYDLRATPLQCPECGMTATA